jgi:hypothetical protein
MDEGHYLAPFLEEKLPELGLDAETYGAYLLGLLPPDEVTLIGDEENTGADEEEWNGVLELLQASSETHSDDENVWKELKQQVLQKYHEHTEDQKKRKAAEEAERLEAIKTPVIPLPTENATAKPAKKNTAIDDQAKKDLLARFAYENDDDDKEVEVDAPAINNKAAAQQANVEKARELRNQSVTTKKEEQMKTKQARQEKQKLKEERRQRATKSERKR